MANINVTEVDFAAVAAAARAAWRFGNEDAHVLDKLARKINASLSNASLPSAAKFRNGTETKLSWKDVPSVLAH